MTLALDVFPDGIQLTSSYKIGIRYCRSFERPRYALARTPHKRGLSTHRLYHSMTMRIGEHAFLNAEQRKPGEVSGREDF